MAATPPRPRRGRASRKVVQAARGQRRQGTPAEARLWEALRSRRLAGLKFRRQHPLGRFILDLFCVEHRLAVEIDGPTHLDPQQAAYDAACTGDLERLGLRVLRFTNAEVEQHLDDVLAQILAATKGP